MKPPRYYIKLLGSHSPLMSLSTVRCFSSFPWPFRGGQFNSILIILYKPGPKMSQDILSVHTNMMATVLSQEETCHFVKAVSLNRLDFWVSSFSDFPQVLPPPPQACVPNRPTYLSQKLNNYPSYYVITNRIYMLMGKNVVLWQQGQSSLVLSRVLGGCRHEDPAEPSYMRWPRQRVETSHCITEGLHLRIQFHNVQLPFLSLSLGFNAILNDWFLQGQTEVWLTRQFLQNHLETRNVCLAFWEKLPFICDCLIQTFSKPPKLHYIPDVLYQNQKAGLIYFKQLECFSRWDSSNSCIRITWVIKMRIWFLGTIRNQMDEELTEIKNLHPN